MIDLQEFKDSLGNTTKELTEGQIIKLWKDTDKMADIFFDMWLKKHTDKQLNNSVSVMSENS